MKIKKELEKENLLKQAAKQWVNLLFIDIYNKRKQNPKNQNNNFAIKST